MRSCGLKKKKGQTYEEEVKKGIREKETHQGQ